MVNNVTLIGRMTATPELRETPDGTKCTSFIIAVDREYVDKEGNRPADFVDITAWRNTAEFITRNFEKGDYIAITGSLQTRHYTSKDDVTRKVTEVRADRANFCGFKRPKETEA